MVAYKPFKYPQASADNDLVSLTERWSGALIYPVVSKC